MEPTWDDHAPSTWDGPDPLLAPAAPTKEIAEIRVWSGRLIDRIEIQYRDGTSVAHGSFGGGRRPPFVLRAGEKLVKIDTRQGDSLDGCKFFTNTGRSSQWYGGLGGASIEFLASAQDPIIDIKRRGGHCSRMTGIVGSSSGEAADALNGRRETGAQFFCTKARPW